MELLVLFLQKRQFNRNWHIYNHSTGENDKSEKTSTFTLTIAANPNYFTYIRYGNNLGLTPEENYADQFDYDKKLFF